jgi:mannan endo-1,4-beta-mannosidase
MLVGGPSVASARQATTTIDASTAPADPFTNVSRQGSRLVLNRQPYRFSGINAYELATQWGTNAGCGAQVDTTELDSFFGALRPDSMVRFWAFQHQAVNIKTGLIDFTPIDRVVAAAARHHQRLIMSLSDAAWTCEGGINTRYKDQAWYNGGYRSDLHGDPLSYATWVDRIVRRYANNPAVGMWEPVNEAEDPTYSASGTKTCSATAATTLRRFFDQVGGQIHAVDHVHLVESGLLGSGQCGAQGSEYQYVHASPGIDVASYHDYGADNSPMPGDQWNGLRVRIGQTIALEKPIIVGEAGIQAQANTVGCSSQAQRRTDFINKLNAQYAAGISGFMPWDWVPVANPGCTYDIGGVSALMMTTLHGYTPPPPTTPARRQRAMSSAS